MCLLAQEWLQVRKVTGDNHDPHIQRTPEVNSKHYDHGIIYSMPDVRPYGPFYDMPENMGNNVIFLPVC